MKESKQFLEFIKEKHLDELIQNSIGKFKALKGDLTPSLNTAELSGLFTELLNEAILFGPENIPTSTLKLNDHILTPTVTAGARDSMKKALLEILPAFTTNITEAVQVMRGLDDYQNKSKDLALEFLGDEASKNEAAALSAEEKLKTVIHDSNTFAYAASHDLQEPLRMVTSYLQLLTSKHTEQLNDEAKEFIRYAMDASSRMRDLINGLLQYSRLNKAVEFQPVKLDDVLSESIRNLEEQIVSTGTAIHREPLPEITGDHNLLTQLFQHVIANAIKFRGSEPPKIDIRAEQTGNLLTIAIKDNGIGIEEKYSGKIFEIFQRLHSKSKYPGSGIGLALCKKITEMHGGSIRVSSELGKGSVFYITFKV